MSEVPQGVAQRVIAELRSRPLHTDYDSGQFTGANYLHMELSAEARRVLKRPLQIVPTDSATLWHEEDFYKLAFREGAEAMIKYLGLDLEGGRDV